MLRGCDGQVELRKVKQEAVRLIHGNGLGPREIDLPCGMAQSDRCRALQSVAQIANKAAYASGCL